MSGTYQGTYHGGNDFTGESVQQVRENLKANAILNGSSLAFVRAGWEPAGFSLSIGGGAGNGFASNGAAVTGGPAAGSVRSGGVVGKGAGVSGVSIPESKWYPGGSLRFGGHALSMADDDKNTVQPLTVGGFDVQTDKGYSDGQAFSNRYGDSELLTTAFGIIVLGADAWKTWSVAGVPAVKGALAPVVSAGVGAGQAAVQRWLETGKNPGPARPVPPPRVIAPALGAFR